MNLAASRLIVLPHASAYRRLVGIVAGVAVATAMLLILLGTYLHLPDRADRFAWIEIPRNAEAPVVDGEPVAPRADAVVATLRRELVLGEQYLVMRVAATEDSTVALPGGIDVPRPGEYYASPALAELIDSVPDEQLRDRYGEFAGVLPDSMLKGRTQLVALVGGEWDEVALRPGAALLTGFSTQGEQSESFTYRTVIAIGSVALLVPIVLLVGIVSQLGAAARRERFATVRLIGAGRRQVATLSALEMGLATLVGAVLGIGVMHAIRPAAAFIRFGGTESFLADLAPSAPVTLGTVAVVTLLGTVSAWRRTYRDDVGALGATRERPEKPATAWRIVPIAAGLGVIGGSLGFASALPDVLLALGLVGGFALVAFGVIFAGSFVTRVLAALVRRVGGSAPAVVAAGRLGRHPRATFRSVAGLVVAVFVVSLFAGLSSIISGGAMPQDMPGSMRNGVLMASLNAPHADAADTARSVEAVEGVERVIVAGDASAWGYGTLVVTPDEARALGAVDVPDASLVSLDAYSMIMAGVAGEVAAAAEPFTGDSPQGAVAFVVTDGSQASVERARTALITSGAIAGTPATRAEFADRGATSTLDELALMAYIGMAIAVAISAVSLTVATIASALERKRTFGLLRLAGMPVSHLRRVIAMEASVPLGGMLVWSAGLGFLVAWMLLQTMGSHLAMSMPDARYWAAMVAAVGIGVVAITSSFGMVRRSTEVSSTRFE